MQRRLAYATTVALLAIGGFFWWARPRILGAVAPHAKVIAVMPFHSSGPGVELLGEGMVDLLSPNLDAVGEIRTVDARTVLHAWNQRAVGGSLDLEGALTVGRDVEAGSILWGTATAAGSDVRLTAELYTVKGAKLAAARADGPADSVLALVDSLSVALLRDIWTSREPLPNLHLKAITTGDLDAIRAYLRGERFYRSSLWDSASYALREAVEADSTFALAHYRLATTYGWSIGHGAGLSIQHSRAAMRFADRLPARDRSLVVANHLFGEGATAAHDSLELYVERYPDDADGWYLLADTRFHARPILGLHVDELFRPFERVRELDPSFAPAFIHPIELSLVFRDSSAYVSWLGALEASSRPEESEPYRLAGDIVWGPPEEAGPKFERLGEIKPFLLGTVHAAGYASSTVDWDSAVAGLELARRQVAEGAGSTPTYLLQALATNYASLGRYEEARAVFDTLWLRDPFDQGFLAMPPIFAGLVDTTYAPGLWSALWQTNPVPQFERALHYLRAVWYLLRDQEAEARFHIEGARSIDESEPQIEILFDAMDAWADVVAGDSIAGMQRMKEALLAAGYRNDALFFGRAIRIQLAHMQSLHEATREEAINRLLYGLWLSDYDLQALRYLFAGQALEQSGRLGEAAQAYELFVHHWEKADPHLQGHVESARRGLERIGSESAK